MSKTDSPSRTIDVTIDGELITIPMSYGLFQDLTKVVPSPEQIEDLLLKDPYLRDYVIRRVLTGNKPVKQEEDLVDPFEVDVSLEDCDEIIAWVMEHVLHFFMNSAQKSVEMMGKYKSRADALTQSNQSLLGSAD